MILLEFYLGISLQASPQDSVKKFSRNSHCNSLRDSFVHSSRDSFTNCSQDCIRDCCRILSEFAPGIPLGISRELPSRIPSIFPRFPLEISPGIPTFIPLLISPGVSLWISFGDSCTDFSRAIFWHSFVYSSQN